IFFWNASTTAKDSRPLSPSITLTAKPPMPRRPRFSTAGYVFHVLNRAAGRHANRGRESLAETDLLLECINYRQRLPTPFAIHYIDGKTAHAPSPTILHRRLRLPRP